MTANFPWREAWSLLRHVPLLRARWWGSHLVELVMIMAETPEIIRYGQTNRRLVAAPPEAPLLPMTHDWLLLPLQKRHFCLSYNVYLQSITKHCWPPGLQQQPALIGVLWSALILVRRLINYLMRQPFILFLYPPCYFLLLFPPIYILPCIETYLHSQLYGRNTLNSI